VTHDQEEALSIADKVVMMRDGRIVQIGTPRDLYETPADASVAAFVGQSNLWPGTVAANGEVVTAIGTLGCETGDHAVGAPVTVFVRPERIEPILGDLEAGKPGTFAGTMSADRYLGPVRRIDIAVAGGVIRVETHLRGAIAGVAIPRDAIRVLPPTELSPVRIST
jgi:putative spermidine/putrescine transport system ATP-binding protein